MRTTGIFLEKTVVSSYHFLLITTVFPS